MKEYNKKIRSQYVINNKLMYSGRLALVKKLLVEWGRLMRANRIKYDPALSDLYWQQCVAMLEKNKLLDMEKVKDFLE